MAEIETNNVPADIQPENNNIDPEIDQNNNNMGDEELRTLGKGVNYWRIVILIAFIVPNYYYGTQLNDGCRTINIFLLVDGILCSIRLFCCIIYLISQSLEFLVIEKIVYNVVILIWLICAIVFGGINSQCTGSPAQPSYIFFWTSVAMTIVYRLCVCVIPTFVLILCYINKSNQSNRVMKIINKLESLTFINGSLVDSKGKIVKTLEKEDDKCGICLADYGDTPDDKIITLPCKHHFHSDCNKAWMTDHSSCPFCRSVVIKVK